MKWNVWVIPNQIFEENYPDGWSTEEVLRAANNRYGGKVQTVSPAGVSSSDSYSSGGGSSSSSGGSGCLGLLVVVGIIAAAISGGFDGDDTKRPSTPPESLSQPQSYVAPPAPQPEPQFRDYASPPPSYCVTENFEPC